MVITCFSKGIKLHRQVQVLTLFLEATIKKIIQIFRSIQVWLRIFQILKKHSSENQLYGIFNIPKARDMHVGGSGPVDEVVEAGGGDFEGDAGVFDDGDVVVDVADGRVVRDGVGVGCDHVGDHVLHPLV